MSRVQLLVLLSCSLQHTCLIHKGSFCIACSRILLGYYGVLLLFFDLVLLWCWLAAFPPSSRSQRHCIRPDRQEERDCPYQEVSELQDYHWAQFQEHGWRSNQQCEGFDFGSCRRPLHQCQNRLHYPLSLVPCEPLLSLCYKCSRCGVGFWEDILRSNSRTAKHGLDRKL